MGETSYLFPPELVVRVLPGDELVALREQLADMKKRLETLQAEYNKTEYRFRCETVINNRLIDFCRENGLRIDPAIVHWSEGECL